MAGERFEAVLQMTDDGVGCFVEVPAAVVADLGGGKRPPVQATLNGYAYRTTIATYGGRSYLGVRREIRAAAALAPGDIIAVGLTLDEAPRRVELPEAFQQALAADLPAQAAFERLSYSHRKEYAQWVAEAKREETRRGRIAKALVMLKEGQRQP
ncbi:MAG: YdeI/OmpD-associated family protein [Chloroflexota bacterium]